MTKSVSYSFLALRQYLCLEVRKPCRCLSFLGERQEENSVGVFFLYLCCQILLVHQHWWVVTFYNRKQMFWINDRNGQDEFILLRQLIKPAIIRSGEVKRLCWYKTSRTDTKILPGLTTNWDFWTQPKLVSTHPETKGKTSPSIDLGRSSPRIIAQKYNSYVLVK